MEVQIKIDPSSSNRSSIIRIENVPDMETTSIVEDNSI